MKTDIPTLYLGIDTGGTFTDGVLLDPISRKVVQAVKSLTTHNDLSICLSQVFEQLVPDDPSRIALVSLSTTLATNAIAEEKRRPVALLLLGYDPELVRKYGFHRQFGTDCYFFLDGRYNLSGVEETPLDETGIQKAVLSVKGRVEAIAISSYAGPVNPSHELRAAELVQNLVDIPIVQAHHLSANLDSIRRATTASLNASLLPSVQGFMAEVQAMLDRRGMNCPVMMVRGNGSIVKAGLARQKPVEVIHSGPATSAIGGQFLADVENALVVDIGGTTTDMVLIEGGRAPVQGQAATVGRYRTCVETIKTHSFGLGGDSLIEFDHRRNLSVGPRRAVPISLLCQQFPAVKQDVMKRLSERGRILYSDDVEYWIAGRLPQRQEVDGVTQRIIDLLQHGPVRFSRVRKVIGALAPIFIDSLIQQEIIYRAGLTPTDLLHVTGEHTPYDVEAARAVTGYAAAIWEESESEFVERVREQMTKKIMDEVIQFLSSRPLNPNPVVRTGELGSWLVNESFRSNGSALGCSIFLKAPIVGIGAPARAFIPPVAEALRTRAIFPSHYHVANAVGAVVGNVIFHKEGDIFPCTEGAAITGYYGRVENKQERFDYLEEALRFVREFLILQVRQGALEAGAVDPAVDCQEKEILAGMYHLDAWAVGRPVSD
jgi:N-methylhydantoinase A/oxoprolinase/acetone carboxylase beta subunit